MAHAMTTGVKRLAFLGSSAEARLALLRAPPAGTMSRETKRLFEASAVRPADDTATVRFRQIFDASPIGIALTSLDDRIVEANPALASMLGYTRDELRGMSAQTLLPQSAT